MDDQLNGWLPRHLRRLADEAVVIVDGPRPPVELVASPPGSRNVVVTGRVTRVPHRAGKLGTERTTTVTVNLPLSWRLALYQLERIMRLCLISMRSG
jgi:hypothetical protein